MVVGNSINAPTNHGMPMGTTQGFILTTMSAKLDPKTAVFARPASTQTTKNTKKYTKKYHHSQINQGRSSN